jgi:hypothetical protein
MPRAGISRRSNSRNCSPTMSAPSSAGRIDHFAVEPAQLVRPGRHGVVCSASPGRLCRNRPPDRVAHHLQQGPVSAGTSRSGTRRPVTPSSTISRCRPRRPQRWARRRRRPR